MDKKMQRRIIREVRYILKTGGTVRQIAEEVGTSKSTVHKDLTERLPSMDECAALEVRGIIERNKAERHIRGGEATRRKYKATV